MKARSDLPQLLLLLTGAAALTALSGSRLPPLSEILRAPSTPFDRSGAYAAASDYLFFRDAATRIPPGFPWLRFPSREIPRAARRCTGRPSAFCLAARSCPRPSGILRLAESTPVRAGYLSLLGLACCPLAGWPLLADPSYGRLSLACKAGLSCAAGAVLISGWMTAFALLGITWRPFVLVLLAALLSYLLRFLLPSCEAADGKEPARGFPARPERRLSRRLARVRRDSPHLLRLRAVRPLSRHPPGPPLPHPVGDRKRSLVGRAGAPHLLPLAALIAAPRKSRLILLPLGTSAGLAAFFVFTYLHGEANPEKWIGWSAGRIFSAIVPPWRSPASAGAVREHSTRVTRVLGLRRSVELRPAHRTLIVY